MGQEMTKSLTRFARLGTARGVSHVGRARDVQHPSSGEVPDPERFLDTLARVDDLRVPSSVARAGGGVGFAGRRAYLSDLFSRDPAVFLERHGDAVAVEHLALFDHLRENYEVDFHLRRLAASASPSERRGVARNRRFGTSRHARTRGLLHGGRHRRREPLLFDTYVGAPRPTAPPGGPDDDPSTSHAVSLSLLEREDDRNAAERLAAARARGRAVDEDTDDDEAETREADDDRRDVYSFADSFASGVVVPRGRGSRATPRSFDAPPWKDGAEDRAERIRRTRTRTRTRSRKDGIDRTRTRTRTRTCRGTRAWRSFVG